MGSDDRIERFGCSRAAAAARLSRFVQLLAVLLLVSACRGPFSFPPGGGTWIPDPPAPTPTPDQPPLTDQSHRFWTLDEVHEFALEIPPESWDLLLDEPREYQPGLFSYGGETWEVGIRLKGQLGSFRPLDSGAKSAFKVDFNFIDPDGHFLGLKKLTLNNMVQDPSCTTEYLGYKLFEALGIPSPRIGYARVWVNGEDRGLYLNVESPDKLWLRRRFDDASGNLYEGTYIRDPAWLFADFLPDAYHAFEHDVMGWPEDRADLISVTNLLLNVEPERLPEALRDVLEYESFLRFAAAEVYLTHWDGYTGNTNNNRIYFTPSTGRFTFLPWGIDQTFRTGNRVGPWGYDNKGILFERVLDHPESEEGYILAMGEVVRAFEDLPMRADWQSIRDLVVPEVYSDPWIDNGRYESYSADVAAFIDTQPDFMRQFLLDD